MNIQIYPLNKVVFDDVSICFGMEKSAVELALGAGTVIGNRYYYFNNEMARCWGQKPHYSTLKSS